MSVEQELATAKAELEALKAELEALYTNSKASFIAGAVLGAGAVLLVVHLVHRI